MDDILNGFLKAQQTMVVRNYDEAEKMLNDIVNELEKMSPSSERDKWLSKAYNNLGIIFYKTVEFKKAQEFFRKSTALNPLFGPSYYSHGVINYRLGLYEAAVKDLNKAVQLEPENAEYLTGLQATESVLQNNLDEHFFNVNVKSVN